MAIKMKEMRHTITQKLIVRAQGHGTICCRVTLLVTLYVILIVWLGVRYV